MPVARRRSIDAKYRLPKVQLCRDVSCRSFTDWRRCDTSGHEIATLVFGKTTHWIIRMTSVDHRSNIGTPSLWDRWALSPALSLRDGNEQSPKKCFCFVNTILWNEFCVLSHMSQSSWGKRVQVRKNLSQNARHWLRVKLIEEPISISISCWLPWAMTLSTSWCW